MKLQLFAFDLPLKHVFRISRGAMRSQPTLIVELEQDGVRGYGEATTNDYYGATIENMAAALEQVRPLLEQRTIDNPGQLWSELASQLNDHPFAQCALDQAAHDLWGKRLGKPVYQLWGLRPENIPPTNYTIGIDEIDVMRAKMREFPDWPVYKIKLGTAHDIEIVRELRQETSALFRVDANCAWTAAETIENARVMQGLGVEFIEQPMPADRWEEMRQVFENSALPVIADESCIREEDVPRCQGHYHGINIKLSKCGGLTPARRMIAKGRQLGMKVMVGCMTESTVGISAIAQLLPLLDYVDMDGALLLAEDIASGVTIEQGMCRYASVPGTGVELTRSGRPV